MKYSVNLTSVLGIVLKYFRFENRQIFNQSFMGVHVAIYVFF